MIRKIILCTMLLVFSIFYIGANAQEDLIGFKIADVYEPTAETVQVPVILSENTGFASMEMIISYDNSVIKPKSVTKAPILNGLFEGNLTYKDNKMKLVYASAENVVGDGAILYITFDVLVKEDIKTTLDMDITFLGDAGFEQKSFTCESGSITMNDAVYQLSSYISETDFDEKKVVIACENRSSEQFENVCVYIALYDSEGNAVSIVRRIIDLVPYENESITLYLDDINLIENVAVMVWNEYMCPYTEVYEYKLR